MKVFLLYKNNDFDMKCKISSNAEVLIQDLELNTLFRAMAGNDDFILEVVKKVVLLSARDIEIILYRQQILEDCLENPDLVRELYARISAAIENRKDYRFSIFGRFPSSTLSTSIELMRYFIDVLKELRAFADKNADRFHSEGFTRLFDMLKKELSDEYFDIINGHLHNLKFRDGILISAELGKGNKGAGYTLRKSDKKRESWLRRLFTKGPPVYSFTIPDRDDGASKALSELRDRGTNLAANALAQSNDHILSFFNLLKTELAFYVGCVTLREQLESREEPVSFPVPAEPDEGVHSLEGLYDICLFLTLKQKIVGNDYCGDDKNLAVITGANQGGKSTFLRSIGLAQLMMQCGMFVPAETFKASICDQIFTHFRRKEDTAMESGKLDEELKRMSDIVDNITPNSMLLLNESFSSTNEREGSEIARQIVTALSEKYIRVYFVTHLYKFSHDLHGKHLRDAVFLRAERTADGARTFKMIEGGPQQTGFGIDLYREIFEAVH